MEIGDWFQIWQFMGGWCPCEVREPSGVGIWKNIRWWWETFSQHTRFVMGDGSTIKFSSICGAVPMPWRFYFQHYTRSLETELSSVADCLETTGEQMLCNITFFKGSQDWKIGSFKISFNYPYSLNQGTNTLWCVPAGRGLFSVRSFYEALTQPQHSQFSWRHIRSNKAPSNALFFTWTASLRKIVTTSNLEKRGMIILIWCSMCKKYGETIDNPSSL